MPAPAVYVALPSVLLMLRFARGLGASVSVADAVPPVSGLVTVAVLTRLPLAVSDTWAVTVSVAVPPARRLTSCTSTSPDPLAVPPEPLEYAADQVAPVSAAGSTSATVTLLTALGPAL